MSLATLKEVLEIAERTNTAIPGFNIDNIEIPEAIMEAAEAENCPVILTIGQGAINAGGLRHLPDVVRRIAESSRVPVVMHLDHGTSYEQAITCLRAGFTSVMYDGSHHPFEENVRESQAVVRAAHAVGVSVECELGAISGVEDGISHNNTNLVDLDEMKRFISVVIVMRWPLASAMRTASTREYPTWTSTGWRHAGILAGHIWYSTAAPASRKI